MIFALSWRSAIFVLDRSSFAFYVTWKLLYVTAISVIACSCHTFCFSPGMSMNSFLFLLANDFTLLSSDLCATLALMFFWFRWYERCLLDWSEKDCINTVLTAQRKMIVRTPGKWEHVLLWQNYFHLYSIRRKIITSDIRPSIQFMGWNFCCTQIKKSLFFSKQTP